MNLKRYQKIYVIVFSLVSCISLLFGVLCFYYNRLPEGLIVIGITLAMMTIGFVVVLMDKNADRDFLVLQAGNVLLSADCSCNVEDLSGQNCKLSVCDNGVFIEFDSCKCCFVDYDCITNFVINGHAILVYTKQESDEIKYRFVCNSLLKIKLINDLLQSHIKK